MTAGKSDKVMVNTSEAMSFVEMVTGRPTSRPTIIRWAGKYGLGHQLGDARKKPTGRAPWALDLQALDGFINGTKGRNPRRLIRLLAEYIQNKKHGIDERPKGMPQRLAEWPVKRGRRPKNKPNEIHLAYKDKKAKKKKVIGNRPLTPQSAKQNIHDKHVRLKKAKRKIKRKRNA